MKRLFLLLIPLILVVALMACETDSKKSNDDDNSSNVASSSSQVSNTTSNDVSLAEGQIEKTFDDVPLIINGTDALAKSNLKATSRVVSVTVKGQESLINQLKSEYIIAQVDVSGVIEKGDIELLAEYSAPAGVTIISSEAIVVVEIKSTSVVITPPSNTDVRIVNGIIISNTQAMEQFGGSAKSGANCAAKLNTFKESVGEGVNVYILPAPLASAFYAPEKYPNSIKNHQNCFYGIRDNLVGVKFVDTLTALGAHTDEALYFRTDHHWQALGAYYAAQELANVAGAPFAELNSTNYVTKSVDGILGSFKGYTNSDPVIVNNPDTMVWYEPTSDYTVTYYSVSGFSNPKTDLSLFSANNGYTKFIHGDSYTTHIKTNVGNGRKLLIFKDSYGNALAPFVLSSFDEVIIADFRYFKLNAKEFIEEQGITDVCFSMSAFSVTGKSDYITKLLNY